MKNRLKTTATLVALFAAIGSTASFAQTLVTYNPGDLVIGFQAKTPGSTGANQNFMLNIGSAAAYNNGQMPLSMENPVANIGDQLSSIYGADWFARGDLNWGAIGMRQMITLYGPTTPVIDGDGLGVIYASKEATGIGESTPWGAFARATAANTSTRVWSLLEGNVGGFDQATAIDGFDGYAAIVNSALDNSWSSHNGDSGWSFNGFQGGVEGSLGQVGDFVYLDIYRVTPDGIAPDWVVTLALDSAGNVYAVPEPSTYAALIGAAGLALVITRRVRRNKKAIA